VLPVIRAGHQDVSCRYYIIWLIKQPDKNCVRMLFDCPSASLDVMFVVKQKSTEINCKKIIIRVL